jgi:2-amino-4-hydroxy-6-hydroxymethyldihydropteridine diphosphokinase
MNAGIALGSNLGDRGGEIRRAFAFLRSFDPSARLSRIHESTPVDCPPGSGLFLNAVVVLETDLPALDLLDQFQAYELQRGRAVVRSVNAPRPIDLDLLFYGSEALDSPRLTLPHPRLHERLFVLLPLVEVAPDFRLPGDDRSLQHWIEAARARSGAETCLPID